MSAAVAVLLFIASFWSGMYVQRNPWIYSDFNPETAAKENADATVQPKLCLQHDCCRKRYAAEFDDIRRSAEESSGIFCKPSGGTNSNSFCTDASSVPVQGS